MKKYAFEIWLIVGMQNILADYLSQSVGGRTVEENDEGKCVTER